MDFLPYSRLTPQTVTLVVSSEPWLWLYNCVYVCSELLVFTEQMMLVSGEVYAVGCDSPLFLNAYC